MALGRSRVAPHPPRNRELDGVGVLPPIEPMSVHEPTMGDDDALNVIESAQSVSEPRAEGHPLVPLSRQGEGVRGRGTTGIGGQGERYNR
jgi:hypothetical protein